VTAGVNDYPFRGRCPGACSQQCAGACGGSEACCQCASFACYRIANDLGRHLGAGYGNANTWVNASIANGIRSDHSPAAHSIVCLPNISSAGHVAFVLAVGPTSAYGQTVPAGWVIVEDYNWDFSCDYRIHPLQVVSSGANETWFLHFNDSAGGGGCPGGCGACEVCSGSTCVSACSGGRVCSGGICICPSGTTWNGTSCIAAFPPPPPPAPGMSSFALVVLAAAAGVGAYEFHHRGYSLGSLLHSPPAASTRGRRAVVAEGFSR
jgi:CHAP domain